MLGINEKKEAEAILEKIYKKPISIPFQKPVDPINDNCPNYDEIIKTPMCLNTVKEKLQNSFYDSLESWIKDIELIWSNAMVYNTPTSPFYLMAEDLRIYFRKKIININKTDNGIWRNEVFEATKGVKNLLEYNINMKTKL